MGSKVSAPIREVDHDHRKVAAGWYAYASVPFPLSESIRRCGEIQEAGDEEKARKLEMVIVTDRGREK